MIYILAIIVSEFSVNIKCSKLNTELSNISKISGEQLEFSIISNTKTEAFSVYRYIENLAMSFRIRR